MWFWRPPTFNLHYKLRITGTSALRKLMMRFVRAIALPTMWSFLQRTQPARSTPLPVLDAVVEAGPRPPEYSRYLGYSMPTEFGELIAMIRRA